MVLSVKRDKPIKEMLKRRFFKVVIVLSLVLWLVTTLWPSLRIVPSIYGKTAVPLHYNIHVGVDTVAPWWGVFSVPALGLAIMLVNVVLAVYMWRREPVLAYMLGSATVVLQVVLLIAMVFIVYLSLQYA